MPVSPASAGFRFRADHPRSQRDSATDRAQLLRWIVVLFTTIALFAGTALSGSYSARADDNFMFQYLSPTFPISESNDLASFDAQVQYGSSLAWAVRWSPQVVASVPIGTKMYTTMDVKINGRCVAWHYNPHIEEADYLWHSSITTFRYCGDAPWTKHRIKDGDTVSLYAQSNVLDGSKRFYFLTFNMKMTS